MEDKVRKGKMTKELGKRKRKAQVEGRQEGRKRYCEVEEQIYRRERWRRRTGSERAKEGERRETNR